MRALCRNFVAFATEVNDVNATHHYMTFAIALMDRLPSRAVVATILATVRWRSVVRHGENLTVSCIRLMKHPGCPNAAACQPLPVTVPDRARRGAPDSGGGLLGQRRVGTDPSLQNT